MAAYLATLSPGSHRTVHQALDTIARMVSGGDPDRIDAATFRWEKLTRADTSQVARQLKADLAPRTVNKMLSALRGVLRACCRLGLMQERQFQSAANFDLVRAEPAPQSRTLSDTEVRRLLRQTHTGDAAGLRDAVVLTVFLCCGPRRSELAALNRDVYDPATGSLTIRGSRPERHRTIKLDARARRAMDAWLAVSVDGKNNARGPLLRAVTKGGLIRKHRLTAQAVYDIIRKAAIGAGMPDVQSRDLRRTAVTKMIERGMDLDTVQHMAGQMSWLTPKAYRRLAAAAGES